MSFVLVFLLGYAVYGATVSTSYFVYETNAETTEMSTADGLDSIGNASYDAQADVTTWRWQGVMDAMNLTWVNVTVSDAPATSELRIINAGMGLWGHPDLGDQDAKGFDYGGLRSKRNKSIIATQGPGELMDLDLTLLAYNRSDARGVSACKPPRSKRLRRKHCLGRASTYQSVILVELSIPGSWAQNEHPSVTVATVNEDFDPSSRSRSRPVRNFSGAAAVVRCFSVLLIQGLAFYYGARRRTGAWSASHSSARRRTEMSSIGSGSSLPPRYVRQGCSGFGTWADWMRPVLSDSPGVSASLDLR